VRALRRSTGAYGDAMTGSERDGAPHLFDQTNGVLGDDGDRPESAPRHDAKPPTSFGVPPITSL
jgi:hypothetical protein